MVFIIVFYYFLVCWLSRCTRTFLISLCMRRVLFQSKGNIKPIVQVAVIAESSQLQATLNTFGITSQTPDEIEPVQIWSQWDLVKVFTELGQNPKMNISGRPKRPIGVLGTSLFYRCVDL